MHYFSVLRSSACGLHTTEPEKEKIRKSVVEWMLYRDYWDKDDNIDRLSKRTGIPRSEISDFLLERTGKRYLTIRKELRMEDAKNLILERQDLNVYEIAQMVGFADKSNFRKDFTEYVGVKPIKWRELKKHSLKRLLTSLGPDQNHCPSPRKSS